MTETEENIPENTEVTPVEEAEIPVENTEKPIALQAARYTYLEQLESRVFDDETIDDNEVALVNTCKSQVLLELVCVADYVTQLPADSPQKKAADVLLNHLYKCYEKVHNMQQRARDTERETRYLKDVAHESFSGTAQNRQKSASFADNVITDRQLLPNTNVINLAGLGLTGGSLAMLTQLINNPTETLKAQLPDLIDELGSRLAKDDKTSAYQFIGQLLTDLTGLKNIKAMTNALEGRNIAVNMLSMATGKGL